MGYYADERKAQLNIRITPKLHKRVIEWVKRHNKKKTDLIEAAILAELDREAKEIGSIKDYK